MHASTCPVLVQFQSTLPLRGATTTITFHPATSSNFNPRSPCGERLIMANRSLGTPQFQSTLPLRGATNCAVYPDGGLVISIHAPLAGSDAGGLARRWRKADFNPRSPCGERPLSCACGTAAERFQSTLPLRGATYTRGANSGLPEFQSTLPLRGATAK